MSYSNNNGKVGYEELNPKIAEIIKECSKPVVLSKSIKTVDLTSTAREINIGFTISEDNLLLVFKNSVLMTEHADFNLNPEKNKLISLKGDWVGTPQRPIHFNIIAVGVTRKDPARQK